MKNFIMRWKKTPLKKRTKFTENVLEKYYKKEELHNLFNSLNKIARLSKANHCKAFFEDNKNKLNKVWAGNKKIINIIKKHPANQEH